jgi:hypothetical protein
MPDVYYGKQSQKSVDSCEPRLQKVCYYIKDVLKIDHSVLEGHRGEVKQNEYFYSVPQRSQTKWPNGKHNRFPSSAVDVVPYVRIPGVRGGIHWHNPDKKIQELYIKEMVRFAAIFQMVAWLKFGVKTRWGGDWDRDWSLMDNKFNDYPHHELDEE